MTNCSGRLLVKHTLPFLFLYSLLVLPIVAMAETIDFGDEISPGQDLTNAYEGVTFYAIRNDLVFGNEYPVPESVPELSSGYIYAHTSYSSYSSYSGLSGG